MGRQDSCTAASCSNDTTLPSRVVAGFRYDVELVRVLIYIIQDHVHVLTSAPHARNEPFLSCRMLQALRPPLLVP